MFSYVSVEERVPTDHPIRKLRVLVDTILAELDGVLASRYAEGGRPSIPPERLLRASLLQVVYSVRSERLLMEQLDYNLLFRWFVGLAMDDAVWDHPVFSKNRDRLLAHDIVEAFFTEVMTLADKGGLLSKEHFSVDGTLIQAWASHKSFVRKDGTDEPPQGGGRNTQANWKGKPRSNDTHPDARLYRKSDNTPALMGYLGHILIENRSGLVVGAVTSHADGLVERAQALRLLDCMPGRHPRTVGADKADDTSGEIVFYRESCQMYVVA